MIFGLHFTFMLAGYSAVGILLGSYMKRYGGATDMDLGLIFMIQPVTIIARPLICATADRYQSHKRLYTWCLLGNSLSYIPFIIIPYLIEQPSLANVLTTRHCYWCLVLCHIFGSLFYCGVKSLGDALTVNYAKRVGGDYTSYRKFGAISFGSCGFLLGYINQNWLLPDFVPTMIVYSTSLFVMSALAYLWPDEYFVIVGRQQAGQPIGELPTNKQVLVHMKSKLFHCFGSSLSSTDNAASKLKGELEQDWKTTAISSSNQDRYSFKGEEIQTTTSQQATVAHTTSSSMDETKVLSVKQQFNIFMLLVRCDIRILFYLLLLFYGGLIGYAPMFFVFTSVNEVCHNLGTCDGSYLAGLMMIGLCATETVCYMIINAYRTRLNHIVMVQISFVSLILHYWFYGLLLSNVSPYFYLVECLHGLEYSISLATSVELGYRFASEVELIMPELLDRGIISKQDDPGLVKISLIATLNACFTLVYDGLGSIIGSFICGVVTENYSFTALWVLIASGASVGFVVVLIVVSMGKCLQFEPKIHKIKAGAARAVASTNDHHHNDQQLTAA